MEKYKLKISIEFKAKDFIQAEKMQEMLGECIFPICSSEERIRSWEIELKKSEKERLWKQ